MVVGVDTHRDSHTAAVITTTGTEAPVTGAPMAVPAGRYLPVEWRNTALITHNVSDDKAKAASASDSRPSAPPPALASTRELRRRIPTGSKPTLR